MSHPTAGSRTLVLGVSGILVLAALAVAWWARPGREGPGPTLRPAEIPGIARGGSRIPAGNEGPRAGAAEPEAPSRPPGPRAEAGSEMAPSPPGVAAPGVVEPPPPSPGRAEPDATPAPDLDPGSRPSTGLAVEFVGPGATGAVATVQALLATRMAAGEAYRGPDGRVLALHASAEAPPPDGTRSRVIVGFEAGGLRLLEAPRPPLGEDPFADLVPPAGLVGEVFRGLLLEVSVSRRPTATAVLLALLVRDASTAGNLLASAGGDPGERLLGAWAALLAGDLPTAHARAEPILEDPHAGPPAHLAVGAALRAGGSPLEAVRDFTAALARRPHWWPAHALAGEALDSPTLGLADGAAGHWAAAYAAAPAEPLAAMGHAYYRAFTAHDVDGALAVLEALLVEQDTLVPAWRMLASVHAARGSVAGATASRDALERVTRLRPSEARAWADYGAACWDWAEADGGPPARRAAAEAYARQTTLDPEDARAWFLRGGALHRIAKEGEPGETSPSSASPARQARLCYRRALALGLDSAQASRACYDLGLLAEASPEGGGDGTESALASYREALRHDPSFQDAATALVAAHLAAGDGTGAAAALDLLPPGTEPAHRRVLEAGRAFLADDAVTARARLLEAGLLDVGEESLAVTLGRGLLVLGHPRAALAVLPARGKDVAALGLRARAQHLLGDRAAFDLEVARLEALDPAEAARVRTR